MRALCILLVSLALGCSSSHAPDAADAGEVHVVWVDGGVRTFPYAFSRRTTPPDPIGDPDALAFVVGVVISDRDDVCSSWPVNGPPPRDAPLPILWARPAAFLGAPLEQRDYGLMSAARLDFREGAYMWGPGAQWGCGDELCFATGRVVIERDDASGTVGTLSAQLSNGWITGRFTAIPCP